MIKIDLIFLVKLCKIVLYKIWVNSWNNVKSNTIQRSISQYRTSINVNNGFILFRESLFFFQMMMMMCQSKCNFTNFQMWNVNVFLYPSKALFPWAESVFCWSQYLIFTYLKQIQRWNFHKRKTPHSLIKSNRLLRSLSFP